MTQPNDHAGPDQASRDDDEAVERLVDELIAEAKAEDGTA